MLAFLVLSEVHNLACCNSFLREFNLSVDKRQ